MPVVLSGCRVEIEGRGYIWSVAEDASKHPHTRLLLEAPVALCLIDEQEQIWDANGCFAEFLGYSSVLEVRGLARSQYTNKDFYEREKHFLTGLHQGGYAEYPKEFVTKDERNKPGYVRSRVIELDLSRYVLSAIDEIEGTFVDAFKDEITTRPIHANPAEVALPERAQSQTRPIADPSESP